MTDAKREQLNIFNKSQPSKKRRKSRTAFTNQQIYQLEKRFLYQKYLTPADRDELASGLDLSTAQVITWFQNRRAKLKRDLEELKADVTAAKSTDDEHQEILANANFNEQELFEKHGLRRCDRKESEDYDSHTYRNNHDDDQGQPRSQDHKRERTPSVDMPRLSPEMKPHERTT